MAEGGGCIEARQAVAPSRSPYFTPRARLSRLFLGPLSISLASPFSRRKIRAMMNHLTYADWQIIQKQSSTGSRAGETRRMGRAKLHAGAPAAVLETLDRYTGRQLAFPRIVTIISEVIDPQRGRLVIFEDQADKCQHAVGMDNKNVQNIFRLAGEDHQVILK